jgi:hypothetical protein
MTCSDIASGTRVSLTYTEEPTCGDSPIGLNVDVVASVAASAGGLAVFTRAAGSFIVDGYLPQQWIRAEGWADPLTNGNWVVQAVTGTELTVYDPGGVIVLEIAGPTVALTMSTLRATGRQLDLQIDTLESDEVRPSRQYSDVRHGFNQVTGSPGFELSNASYTDFLRSVMSGAWVTPVIGTPGTVTLTIDDPIAGQSTFTRTTGSWYDQGFRPGDMVAVVDGSNPTNDGTYRVLVMDPAFPLALVVDTSFNAVPMIGGTTGVVSYPGARIDIGLNLRTFTMERRFDDIIQYQTYRGCVVNAMNLSVTPDSIAGGTFDMLGMSGTDMIPTSLLGSDVPVPSPTTSPFAAFQGRVYEGGIPIAVMTSMELAVDNQRTLEGVIGSKTSPAVFEGRCSVNGTMSFFLRGNTTYTKFFNETETSVWLRLQDPNDAAHFMNIVMPRVKFIDGAIDPPSEGPVPLNVGYRSLEMAVADVGANATLLTSLTIQANPLRQAS